MKADPIIAEVWAVRDEYAARFDYDVKEMFRDLKKRQQESGREYLGNRPRRPGADAPGGAGSVGSAELGPGPEG